jgi:hypothetical protein
MNKVNWTEITGEELKTILRFIKDQRDMFSSFESDMLPEAGKSCTHSHSSLVNGSRLDIELKIERKSRNE